MHDRHPSDVAWEKVHREEEAVIKDLAVEAHVQQAYNIYEAAQSGSGINVYHVTAFFPRPSNYLRALICVTLQLVVVSSIIVTTIHNAPSYCPKTGDWTGKLACAALLVYANFTLISQRFTFSKSWDYAYIEKDVGLPKLVRQPTWIPHQHHCPRCRESGRCRSADSVEQFVNEHAAQPGRADLCLGAG